MIALLTTNPRSKRMIPKERVALRMHTGAVSEQVR
jgi:hypothetical protein